MIVLGRLSGLMIALLLTGCSAQQVATSQALVASIESDSVFVLQDEVTLKARRTAPLRLRAGTRWRSAGTIDQGEVFDTRDQVVVVNSFDVHEASIVVDEQTIVGYYLKVEKTFVETDAVTIVLTRER